MSGAADRPGSGSRWRQLRGTASGGDYARVVAERLTAQASRGGDVHGEAAFVSSLVEPPAAVLDAGCGTGRVGIRLAELGYAVTGVDVEPSMLAVARQAAPEVPWLEQDLAELDLGGSRFDVVLAAGNVVPLLAEGDLTEVVRRLAEHLRAGGLLVTGFGLDAAHLPAGCPVTPLADYDAAADPAGLRLLARHGTWEGAPFTGGGYAVSVHTGG